MQPIVPMVGELQRDELMAVRMLPPSLDAVLLLSMLGWPPSWL